MTITAYIPNGIYRVDLPIHLGSMTLVGGGNLIEAPTIAALKDHIHDLHDIDVSQDCPLTFTALVSSVPVALHSRAFAGINDHRAGAFGRLRNYFHAVRRFLAHGL